MLKVVERGLLLSRVIPKSTLNLFLFLTTGYTGSKTPLLGLFKPSILNLTLSSPEVEPSCFLLYDLLALAELLLPV